MMHISILCVICFGTMVDGQVVSVDFSKDGDWIRSNCEGGQLHIWDSNKGKHQVFIVDASGG